MRSETSVVATRVPAPGMGRTDQGPARTGPEGMKVSDWCEIHGISRSNYYYRLRQVRRACLAAFSEEQLPGQVVPVDQGLLAKLPSATTPMEPGLDIWSPGL